MNWPDPDAANTCRVMETRRCPGSYGEDGCQEHPCARFESDDEGPWLSVSDDDCDYDDDYADVMTPDEVWTEGGIKD